jgi:hypothetical protein
MVKVAAREYNCKANQSVDGYRPSSRAAGPQPNAWHGMVSRQPLRNRSRLEKASPASTDPYTHHKFS